MDATMELFALAYPGLQANTPNGNEGEAYFDVLLDALQADDDDNDISNGTPNSDAITAAFAEHGITLISNAELEHDEVLFAAVDEGILIEASLDIDIDFIDFLQSTRLYYKINDDQDWTTADMDNVGGDDYAYTIPAQPMGTVIQYYVTAIDINGIEASTLPLAANKPSNPNIPFFIMVGYQQLEAHDSDDNSDWGDWETGLPSDNATTGLWEENVPIGTSGGTVAPDEQNTEDGELCFLTGQSNDPDAIGENDVDAGTTTLQSPMIDLTGLDNPAFSYYRWYTNSPPTGANPGADWWQGYISDDGGNTWVRLDETQQSDASWRRYAFRVQDYVDVTDQFMMRFNVSDSIRPGQNLDGGSLVEGALDDIVLWDEGVTGLNEKTLDAELNIFPNPANDNLNVEITIDNADKLDIEILNSLGQIVERRNLGDVNGFRRIVFNTSDLNAGNYQLRLISNNQSKVVAFNKL
ncbi:MAG: T9SS type A sorting domain-containing protein [Bacteroidota bacterium]